MNIQPRRLLASVITAVALMLCLGFGLIGVMVLGRGEDAIDEASSASESAQEGNCQFTAASEQLVVYQAPIQALSQRKAALLGGETYPVIQQNNDFFLLQLAEGDSGWANSLDGTTEGDCENIPTDETPLANFPRVCAFNNPQEVVLYSEPDLVNAVGTVPPGSYLIKSTTGSQYYIVLDRNTSGWVAGSDGQIAGACDALPVAPG